MSLCPRPPHQVNGSQCIGGGHIRTCPLDSPNGKLGLAQVILTGCQGIPKSLPDDVLKVRVHGGMRARSDAKEKPRRSGAPVPLLVPCVLARPRPRRSMRRSTSEPAAEGATQHAAGSTAGRPCPSASQRHRPSYTVSPAGQRLKYSRPRSGSRASHWAAQESPAGAWSPAGLKWGYIGWPL